MTAALVGFGGVIGAAILAAFSAIFGPSLLHRLQRQAKASDDAVVKKDATIRRLVEFRKTGRSWFDVLERVAGDFDAGREITLDEFDTLVEPLREVAVKSVYEMAFDDEWIQSAPIASTSANTHYLQEGDVLDTNSFRSKSEVLDCLRRATKLLRDDVRANRSADQERITSRTWDAIENARRARATLNANLLAQIETMTS